MLCACGTDKNFTDCCAPYLANEQLPPTAEALMRSRYTAFAKLNIDYLKMTLAPEHRHDFDKNSVHDWAAKSTWLGLEIKRVEQGGLNDVQGIVEFIAHYNNARQTFAHHEIATFRKESSTGQWFFVSGQTVKLPTLKRIVRETPKVGRNEVCTCGSGKKYKKCCASS